MLAVSVAALVLITAWKVWRDHNEYSAESLFDVIDKAKPVNLESAVEKRRVWNLLCAARNARLLISLCSHVRCDTAELTEIVADVRAEAYRVFFGAIIGLCLAFLHLPGIGYSGYLKTHYQKLCSVGSELCLNLSGPIASFESALFT